jgi:hypothetical protein
MTVPSGLNLLHQMMAMKKVSHVSVLLVVFDFDFFSRSALLHFFVVIILFNVVFIVFSCVICTIFVLLLYRHGQS